MVVFIIIDFAFLMEVQLDYEKSSISLYLRIMSSDVCGSSSLQLPVESTDLKLAQASLLGLYLTGGFFRENLSAVVLFDIKFLVWT